jgi:hypothetical protein
MSILSPVILYCGSHVSVADTQLKKDVQPSRNAVHVNHAVNKV